MTDTTASSAAAAANEAPGPIPGLFPGSFPYVGPAQLRQPVVDALKRVVDPEVAMNIVDVGLVYGVTVTESGCHLRLTMTSAACPVAGLIVEEAETELGRALPGRRPIEVELVWEPAWSPERMSERGRRVMGW